MGLRLGRRKNFDRSIGQRLLRGNIRCSGRFFGKELAARLGVEPRQNESESFVLPLHHRAVENFERGWSGGAMRSLLCNRTRPTLRLKATEGRLPFVALRRSMEPAMGFEPATACLQNRCSTVELRRQDQGLCHQDLTGKKRENSGMSASC